MNFGEIRKGDKFIGKIDNEFSIADAIHVLADIVNIMTQFEKGGITPEETLLTIKNRVDALKVIPIVMGADGS